MKNKKATE